MNTSLPAIRRLVLPLAFSLACVVLAFLTWQSFGGALPFQAKDYQVKLRLLDATNIYADSDVQVAGVKIGDVGSVERVGNDAVATLEIDDRYAPLHEGAGAIPRTKTLLGEGYIELSFGPPSAPLIGDGGSLDPAGVRPAQQLEEVLDTFRPQTRADMRELFAGLSKAIEGRSGDLNDSIGSATPATESLRALMQTLDAQRGDVQQMIARSGEVLGAVGERAGTARAAVIAGNQVLDATARRADALAATVNALPPFLGSLRDLSSTLDVASGDIGVAVDALRPVTPRLRAGLEAINAAAPRFRSVFGMLPGVIGAGRSGLPALERVLATFRTASPPVYRALRELLPVLHIFAVNRGSVVGFFANVAQLSNKTFIGAGGLSLRGVNGVPSFWNETFAGWVRKLGSNRQNAYIKPGGLEQIAKGKLLAYDCRNTGNPTYIPPTGDGNPVPCAEQGAWTFRGKTRYFPRLTLDPP